ncbi:hypothetical protein NBRC110019_15770 [Neptunitalea chrysea]|uniref:DUF2007 domain-containing protein n=1 Tax=Neptunitalea chrysea TaxID=1647581 RepID=A0A9W6EVI1_9FLAO|nr:hypothetical protein [Neptunitalea chrysea]GLB52537.1 hypothetical protein NBRC110019_15770 [Neptunitalea chrysea]
MADQSFRAFRFFTTLEQANDMATFLEGKNIPTQLADNVPPLDTTFSGSTVTHQVEVQIPQNYFAKAEALVKNEYKENLDDIDPEYYLFSFTNEELYDVLLKYDEWGDLDYQLAQKILKNRGKTIDNDVLEALKRQRLKDLSQPEKNQTPWIFSGYLFALLGGFIGILIGYSLFANKKTLPNGTKVYAHTAATRAHGHYIFYLGIGMFLVTMVLRLSGKAI